MFKKIKSKCFFCNNYSFNFNTYAKEDIKICKNCARLLDKYNKPIANTINQYSLHELKESYETKKSIFDLNNEKLYNKRKQAEMERKEKKNKLYEYYLHNLKFIHVQISDKKTKKKSLQDINNFKLNVVNSKTNIFNVDNFIVIDTETTGLRASTDELLEISAIKFVDFEPIECLTTLICPKHNIPYEIEKINHINDDMVKNAPKIEYIMQNFSNFIKGYNLVGYNLEFDVKFLHKNGMELFIERRRFYDVLPMCKKYFKNYYLPNYKLDTICNYMGIRKNNAHRATEDALATGILFRDIGHSIIKK